ncbi:hypothetical protein D3C87_1690040 [compost metagenome]
MPRASGVGWHIWMNFPTDGAKSLPSLRQFCRPKRICSICLMPSAMNAFTQVRLAVISASSVGQACRHAGNIACNSLNSEFTTSAVPVSILSGAVSTAGRLPRVCMS